MHQKILFLPLIEIEKNCADSRKIQGIAVNIGIKKTLVNTRNIWKNNATVTTKNIINRRIIK